MLTDITLYGLVYSLCLLVHCASAHCPNDQKPPTPMAPTAAAAAATTSTATGAPSTVTTITTVAAFSEIKSFFSRAQSPSAASVAN